MKSVGKYDKIVLEIIFMKSEDYFMGLFGKKKKDEKAKEIKNEPIKAPKAETKTAPKTAAKPAAKTAPKAETKPAAKTTPKATAKPAEKAPAAKSAAAPKAPAKNAAKAQAAPKATAKPAEKAPDVKKAEPKKSAPVGKFEIKKAKDDRYVFNLYAANQVIVATSQVYSSSTSAVNGIKSVIENAEKAPIEDQTLKSYETLPYPKWEIYLDKGNQYRFRLNASNGSCICHSQGYTTKASCKNGIESIKKTAKDAVIDKSYLKKD